MFRPAPRRRPVRAQATALAADAAGILERDYGIDAGEVLSMNVDTVETVSSQTASTDLDFQAVVNGWERYGENCWSVNSKNQITCDHAKDAWGNSAILCNGDYATGDASVDISFNQSAAGTLHNGVFFNVSQNPDKPNVLSGYFISLSQHETAAAYKNQRVLWRFENWYAGDSAWGTYSGALTWCNAGTGEAWEIWRIPGATKTKTFNGYTTKVTCLASWTNDGTNIDYNIHAEDGRIKVSTRQGSVAKTVADVADTYGEPFKYGTYGFYGANCEQTAPFAISNLTYSYTQTKVKSFGDIVYEPNWTDGALHMLINIDTLADKTMLGSDGGTESRRRTKQCSETTWAPAPTGGQCLKFPLFRHESLYVRVDHSISLLQQPVHGQQVFGIGVSYGLQGAILPLLGLFVHYAS